MAADTGSVAMNTRPKAKPPMTRCQYHGMANIGLVSEPISVEQRVMATMPMTHAEHDAPVGDAGVDQERAADQAGQRRGLAHGALHVAEERVPPADAVVGAARGRRSRPMRERGRAGVAVDRVQTASPDICAG